MNLNFSFYIIILIEGNTVLPELRRLVMINIRKAKKSDYMEIKKLIENYPQYLMSEIPSINRFFVALQKGNIVGCCALDIYSKRIAEVRSLAVKKGYQKLGIGTKLAEKCLSLAIEKGIKEIFVITSRPHIFSDLGFGAFQGERLALFKKL
jgi:amino-acid N-acetyltransferase